MRHTTLTCGTPPWLCQVSRLRVDFPIRVPSRLLGVSRRDLQKRLGQWLVTQHGVQWRVLGDTQRQTPEFISGPSLGTGAKFMTLNRIQSMVVTGLLAGHNTLRRHLYLLGLPDSHLRWKCGCEWKPRTTFCVSARFWPHSDIRTWGGSFFLEPGYRKEFGFAGSSGTRLRGSHDSIWGTGPVLIEA